MRESCTYALSSCIHGLSGTVPAQGGMMNRPRGFACSIIMTLPIRNIASATAMSLPIAPGKYCEYLIKMTSLCFSNVSVVPLSNCPFWTCTTVQAVLANVHLLLYCRTSTCTTVQVRVRPYKHLYDTVVRSCTIVHALVLSYEHLYARTIAHVRRSTPCTCVQVLLVRLVQPFVRRT
jgi:hypothetical protein